MGIFIGAIGTIVLGVFAMFIVNSIVICKGDAAALLFPSLLILTIVMLFGVMIGAASATKTIYPIFGIEKIQQHELKKDCNVVSNWVTVVYKDGRAVDMPMEKGK